MKIKRKRAELNGVGPSPEVAQAPEEVMARVWGTAASRSHALAWWERDALGIPPSEDYWALRRRVKGS